MAAIIHRAIPSDIAYTGLSDPNHPDIGPPPTSNVGSVVQTAAPKPVSDTSIVNAGALTVTAVLVSSVPVTVVQTPTPTATISPSATPAPQHSGGLSTGVIAGIAVAVAAILLIPAIYLIWRSHQIKKEVEWGASQRNSQEAMIMKESGEPKRENGPPPPRPRRSPSTTLKPRPANSLGLFNFDLGSPAPIPGNLEKPSTNAKNGPRLSIAKTLQKRRSEVSAINNQERMSQQRRSELRNGLRNNPPTNRNSREVFGESPPPYNGTPSPDSKFAPLDSIGTAVTAGRPKFSRNPSISTIPTQASPTTPQEEMPRPRTATGPRQPPPGTQDMRPVLNQANLLAAQPPQSRTMNPPLSAYSMSDYHDSLRAEAKPEAKPAGPSEPSLQPPEQVNGRAVSPLHRSISPINNYQLPTLGLGGDDRFSWGVGVNHSNNNNNNNETDRTSDVSGLSYNPAMDNRKSSGRAISPVESVEDLGMRTREYL